MRDYNMTLAEDFDPWWKLAKYRKQDIPAKEYSDVRVAERIPSHNGKDWPGEEEGVTYFVRLDNGVYVGFIEERTPSGRRKKHAKFPVYKA